MILNKPLTVLHRMAAAALVATGGSMAPVAVMAQPQNSAYVSLPVGASQIMKLGFKKSKIIDLPKNARDVIISDPTIATAVLRDSRRIFLTGIAVGQADMFVLDEAGGQILHLSLLVERDNAGLEGIISRLVPDGHIHVEVINDNIVLSGTVKNAGDSTKAEQIANMFANGGQNASSAATVSTATATAAGGQAATTTPAKSSVTNLLTIEGEDQVQLKVSVVEMQRTVAKQLGININLQGSAATLVTANPVADAYLTARLTNGSDFSATLQALEDEGLARKLAEPTLTAISGETATFLAGGEYPVPTAYDATQNQTTYTFKQYGVSLAFTPVTLSEGRISLKVMTEVSELSDVGAFVLGNGEKVEATTVRRAQSTLELPSGGTLALGGLLQDNITQSVSGTPGLKDLPILGALFKSRDFQRQQTELVILVTPYMVRPTTRSAFARPDDGFEPPGDAEGILLGRLNKVYGKSGKPPKGAYGGQYGFIYD